MTDDNRLQQEEEIEVLSSIYPQNITIYSTQQIDLRISTESQEALLRISFPPSYPSEVLRTKIPTIPWLYPFKLALFYPF